MKIRVKKGLDLPLKGALSPDEATARPVHPNQIAICPDDFPGFIPKADVNTGDVISAGHTLMHHKNNEAVCLVSPVDGTVREVVRGERRKIMRIVVDCADNASAQASPQSFDPKDAASIFNALAKSGLLAMMRQRPYDIVPTSQAAVRDIFVTAFTTAPLSRQSFADNDDMPLLEAAVAMLTPLTDGKVYISRRPGTLDDVKGAVMVDVTGPHPAGNVGIQIANVKPINKGETIWTLDYATLRRVGMLALGRPIEWTAPVCVTGACLASPYLASAPAGCQVSALFNTEMLSAKAAERHFRIIAGNVLTGVRESADGFTHWPYSQLTVIPEGDDVDQFMGWATLSPDELSVSPSFTGSWLRKLFNPDARMHGARRAMIMSGIYENYLPMDIMLEYLVKAINADDIENMEKLGIYEIAPEDVALAEFADSSKMPLQSIIRHGIDLIRKENE